jgi:hypothetical protein
MNLATLLPEDKIKNIIIEILSADWPLSAKKIHNRIKIDYKRNVSYQAIFKALTELNKEQVLKKENYDYSLSLKWIDEVCNKYENIKRIYESKPKNIFLSFMKEKTFTIEFDTYYKALSTILQLMDKLGFLIGINDDRNYLETNHLYWPFAGSEKEQEKLKVLFKKFRAHILCKSNTPLDKIVMNHYKKLDPNVSIVFGKKTSMEHETLVAGDYVAQVFYQKDSIKFLNQIYAKNDLNKVGAMCELLFNKKTKITAIVTKNSQLADLERKRIMHAMNKI